jgi:hypothetical protein
MLNNGGFMKLRSKTLIAFLICSIFSLPVFAVGFTAGDLFSTFNLEGSLNVSCSGTSAPSFGHANCRGQILSPSEYSYFQGPKDTNLIADKVSLSAVREDGSISKSKIEDYDSVKGLSKKSFNLWISTVFQRPLLAFGKNTVNYTLTKNGNVVLTGSFVVDVVSGGRSVCQRTGFYTSSFANDCAFPANFCSRYFSENNYCQ